MIRNLTPHAVTLLDATGQVVRQFEPELPLPRVAVRSIDAESIDGLPTVRQQYGEVQNLPAEEAGTFLIVSALVQKACPERQDLLIPALPVRDADGRIIGCRAFARR